MKLRGRASAGATTEVPRDVVRVRGALVGGTSGALAIAAHGWAGGALPGQSSVAVLLLACAVVGALASLGEKQKGLAVTVGQSTTGQFAAHLALALTAEHAHALLPSVQMSAAHLVAAFVCSLAIGAADRGLTRAASTIRLAFVVPVDGIPVLDDAPTPRPRTRVATILRLLVSSGLGMRAPPYRVVSIFD